MIKIPMLVMMFASAICMALGDFRPRSTFAFPSNVTNGFLFFISLRVISILWDNTTFKIDASCGAIGFIFYLAAGIVVSIDSDWYRADKFAYASLLFITSVLFWVDGAICSLYWFDQSRRSHQRQDDEEETIENNMKSDEPDVTDTTPTGTLKEKLTSMTHLPKIVKVQALFLTMMTMLISWYGGGIYYNVTIGCSILTFYRLCRGDQTPVFDLLVSYASFLSYFIYVATGNGGPHGPQLDAIVAFMAIMTSVVFFVESGILSIRL